MILRLLRASFEVDDAPAILLALREEIPRAQGWPGLQTWIQGVRREGELLHGMTLSIWDDVASILAMGGGRAAFDISHVGAPTGPLRHVGIDHYELVEPVDLVPSPPDGAVLGVIWGKPRPNADALVQGMIRKGRPAIMAAGVIALHIGRRMIGGSSEVVAIAMWRNRLSLRSFAQDRVSGVIDPAFTAQLLEWRFETYACLTPARLDLGPQGPCAFVVDAERRCVDVMTGVEALLGMPGELVLHRTLDELVDESSAADLAGLWERLGRDGAVEGQIDLSLPGRGRVRTVLHARADVPAPGLCTIAFTADGGGATELAGGVETAAADASSGRRRHR